MVLAQPVGNVQPLLGCQFINILIEQIILQCNILHQHLCMEDIRLIHIHIHRIVMLQGGRINVILNGGNIVVDEKLLAAHIPGKAPNPVVNGDDIRVKAADQIIEGVQRRTHIMRHRGEEHVA